MVNFEQSLLASIHRTISVPYWDWTEGPEEHEVIPPNLSHQGPWAFGFIKKDPTDPTIGGQTRRYSCCAVQEGPVGPLTISIKVSNVNFHSFLKSV